MRPITRKDFLKISTAITGLVNIFSFNQLGIYSKKDSEKALRKEISKMMDETNTMIEYYHKTKTEPINGEKRIISEINYIDSNRILEDVIPAHKLPEIKTGLQEDYEFLCDGKTYSRMFICED